MCVIINCMEKTDEKIIEGLKLLREQRESGKKLSQEVFDHFCGTVVTTPVEIVAVTGSGKVLMIKRAATDTFFPNMWHTTGSIQLPRETMKKTIDRVLNKELADFKKIGELRFVGVLENNMGPGDFECTREQERSVVFVQEVEERQDVDTNFINFFAFDSLPVESIPFHIKKLIPKVVNFLKDGIVGVTFA